MSRSIHETWRMLKKAHREKLGDSDKQAQRLNQIREKLNRKSRIKERIDAERREKRQALEPALQGTDASTIPIRVHAKERYIHYPASPDDLRAIMQRLPKGSCDGLAAIILTLAKHDHELGRDDANWDYERDPYHGRLGSHALPKVWCGRWLGKYYQGKAEIRLFAYVYDPDLPDRELWEFVLRMRALSTFVHELAHHHDCAGRMARDRWLGLDNEQCESFAIWTENQWLHQVVVPYLEESYPTQASRFQDWVEHYGGIRLTLDRLAGDPRKSIFNIQESIESLAQDVCKGLHLRETRINFADYLHMEMDYESALAIVERVLAEHPACVKALTLKADIFVHLKQYEAARAILLSVLEEEPANAEVWEQLAAAYEGLKVWDQVQVAITRIFEINAAQRPVHLLQQRIRARIELHDFFGVEEDVQALEQQGTRYAITAAKKLREELRARRADESGAPQ